MHQPVVLTAAASGLIVDDDHHPQPGIVFRNTDCAAPCGPAHPNPVGASVSCCHSLPTIALFRAVSWCFCGAPGDSQGHGLGTYVSVHQGALSAHLGALYSGEFRNRVVV